MDPPEVFAASSSMEDFAFELAAFLDSAPPCRFDILLHEKFGPLSPNYFRCLLLRAQRVVKWCERRRKARPHLPYFQVNGRYPRLWIHHKALQLQEANAAHPHCIEYIEQKLAIDLKYLEQRHPEIFSVSVAVFKPRKRMRNMSMREALEKASKHISAEHLVHICETQTECGHN